MMKHHKIIDSISADAREGVTTITSFISKFVPLKKARAITFIAEAAFVFLLVVLSVNRYSPKFLNADVILDSVMSLQNVTLFYWGQNRLLNVVPFVISWISVPDINLYARLLIGSFVFYALLWLCADITSISMSKESKLNIKRREMLVLSVGVVFLVLKQKTIFAISIWHIEYTVSYLLLGVAFFYCVNIKRSFMLLIVILTLLLGVATGINNSILIPGMALVIGKVLVYRKLDIYTFIYTCILIIVFIFWMIVAAHYPGHFNSYAEFDLHKFNLNLPFVLKKLIDSVHLANIFICVLIFFCFKVFLFRRIPVKLNSNLRHDKFTSLMLVAFSGGWLLLFSVNKWVEMNAYSPRYFFPVFIVGILFFNLKVKQIYSPFEERGRVAISFMIALGIVFYLFQPFVPLRNYDVFSRLRSPVYSNVFGYAGDYWYTWPAVMYELIAGRDTFGFSDRSTGNLKSLQAKGQALIDREGRVEVICLKADVAKCSRQVQYNLGALTLSDVSLVNDDERILTFEPLKPRQLKYTKETLSTLPSEVGTLSNGVFITNRCAGFLVYGPYVPESAGVYYLKIFGSARNVAGAWVDVVSQKGKLQHAKVLLKHNPKEDNVLAEFRVKLDSLVNDLEVRVFVTKEDEITLEGWELEPLRSQDRSGG